MARHRSDRPTRTADPGPAVGALAAASLDRATAQALGELTAAWLHSLPGTAGPGRPNGRRRSDAGLRSGLVGARRAMTPALEAAPSHWTTPAGQSRDRLPAGTS